jgi:hypothetical protein
LISQPQQYRDFLAADSKGSTSQATFAAASDTGVFPTTDGIVPDARIRLTC